MRPIILACALLLACGSVATGSGTSGGGGTGAPPLGPSSPDGGPADGGAPDGGAPDGGGGPVKFVLNVSVNGQGAVRSTPAGIDCGSVCAAVFDAGTPVSLAVQAASGWRFDGWGGACTGPGACNVAVSGDTTVYATFVPVPPQQHSLTVTVTGTSAGTVSSEPPGIDCGSACSAGFADGSSVTLKATAAPGSLFGGWAGACSGNASCTVTMSGDQQVSARFEPSAPPPLAYSIAEIPGVEGVSDLNPTSINRSGDVVGGYSLSLSTAHAFLYEAASRTTRRIAVDSTDVQGATGINSARQVAISTLVSPPVQQRGNRWQDGSETSIGALPSGPSGPQAGANAINESGWIAGWSLGSANWQRAVLWDGITLHDLGSLGGTWSMANALNGNGVVVGSTNVAGDAYPHAAAFMNGSVRDLGSPGPAGSTAYGINDAGRIVGSFAVIGGGFHAFVFDLPDGPMRDVSPGKGCELVAVNGPADAVGSCSPAEHVVHAALWRGGAMIDLNDAISDPSWVLTVARAINDAGQIVGRGTHDGESRAFLLTPR